MTKRNLLKTMTYAGMHFAVAFTVAFLLSGSIEVALGIGVIEPLVQTFFYNLHESLWQRPRTNPYSPAR